MMNYFILYRLSHTLSDLNSLEVFKINIFCLAEFCWASTLNNRFYITNLLVSFPLYSLAAYHFTERVKGSWLDSKKVGFKFKGEAMSS